MESGLFAHTALALWAVVVGAFLCAVYDVFRVFRLRRKQKTAVLFVCDFVFSLICTVCMLLLFFNLSYGRMRAYAFACALVGFLIWRFTVSRVFIALVQKLLSFAGRTFNSIKMRVSAIVSRVSRRIYTKFYCRRLVSVARNGAFIKKRKEIKDDRKETGPHQSDN